ncbi:MAG TPA: FAD-dependent oxidoreductase [Baekduia sp.]|nr:FAD-dependent oxidoreductase [Baekduia sp.]
MSEIRVVVAGAGLIGLCTAWELARAGAHVTVVDSGSAGGATSSGATGWIVPALSAPLAAPGSIAQGARLMLRRDRPFFIAPRASLDLARWLIAFRRSATPDRYAAATAVLTAINQRTLELYDGLAATGVEFEMHGGGLTFLGLSEELLDMTEQRFINMGYADNIERLSGAEIREREPMVAPIVAGAVHARPERFVRPETLNRGLADALAGHGAELVENSGVRGLRRQANEWIVELGDRDIPADRVVVAAGIWTNDLLRNLGIRLPLQPGKGYSLTTRSSSPPPNNALFFVEAMIGISPFENAVRLAGMVELTGMDRSIKPRRIEALRAAARRYLDGWDPGEEQVQWAGLRPLTPDGLPIVGAVPGQEGLFLATGHGMIGLTLAPSSAALLAPVVLGGDVPAELQPLRVGRF